MWEWNLIAISSNIAPPGREWTLTESSAQPPDHQPFRGRNSIVGNGNFMNFL